MDRAEEDGTAATVDGCPNDKLVDQPHSPNPGPYSVFPFQKSSGAVKSECSRFSFRGNK